MERRKRYLLGDGEAGRTLKTHGEGGTNAEQTREQVVATVGRWNQQGRLRHNYTESKDSVLIRFDLHDGSRVSITKPINPYTPETFLVTAFPPNGPRQQLTAEYVYEKSDSLQYKYWQATLAQMISLEKQTPLENTSLIPGVDAVKHTARRALGKTDPQRYIFFMENTGPLSYIDDKYRREDLEGYSPRTSRTGAEIHLHVAAINERWLTPGMHELPNLHNEREFIRELQANGMAETFGNSLREQIASYLPENFGKRFLEHTSFIIEDGIPRGYSLRFTDINDRNALNNVAYFAEVMKAHFQAYKDVQRVLFGDSVDTATIPQPSFRTYGTFEKGKKAKDRALTVTISPQIFSFGGPLEAAGVELQRGPDFPSLGTAEQKSVYRARLLRRTRHEMWDKSHELRRVRKFIEPEWP